MLWFRIAHSTTIDAVKGRLFTDEVHTRTIGATAEGCGKGTVGRSQAAETNTARRRNRIRENRPYAERDPH